MYIKKILSGLSVLILFSINFGVSYGYGEDILGLKCSVKDYELEYDKLSRVRFSTLGNSTAFKLEDENKNLYIIDGIKYELENNYYLKEHTLEGKGYLFFGDNDKRLIINNGKKYEYTELASQDIEDGGIIYDDTYIFFGKKIGTTQYRLVINGEESYIFTDENKYGGTIFSNDGKHYIVGFSNDSNKEEEFIIYVDGKKFGPYLGINSKPKFIDDKFNFSFIVQTDENELDDKVIKNMSYIVNGNEKLTFEYIINNGNEYINFNNTIYDSDNFYIEFINNDIYVFGTRKYDSILEIFKNGSLVKTIENVTSIVREYQSLDGLNYSLIFKKLGNSQALLNINNGNIFLDDKDYSYILNVIYSSNGKNLLYVGKKYENNNHRENLEFLSLVNNFKIIGKYKDIDFNYTGFKDNNRIYYSATDLYGVKIIKLDDNNIYYSKERDDGNYNIYYNNDKLFVSKEPLSGNSTNIKQYNKGNDYIISGIDINDNIFLYKNGVKVFNSEGKGYNIVNLELSPGGKKYFLRLHNEELKKDKIVINGKVLDLENGYIFGLRFVTNIGDNNYKVFLIYLNKDLDGGGNRLYKIYIDGEFILDASGYSGSPYKINKGGNFEYTNFNIYKFQEIGLGKEYILINNKKSKQFNKIFQYGIIEDESDILFNFLASNNENSVSFYSCDLNNINTEIDDIDSRLDIKLDSKSKSEIIKYGVLGKRELKKTVKGKKNIYSIDKFVEKTSKEKLKNIFLKFKKIDTNLDKFKKYKYLLNYLKAKVLIKIR